MPSIRKNHGKNGKVHLYVSVHAVRRYRERIDSEPYTPKREIAKRLISTLEDHIKTTDDIQRTFIVDGILYGTNTYYGKEETCVVITTVMRPGDFASKAAWLKCKLRRKLIGLLNAW